jgi:hypothetical protein
VRTFTYTLGSARVRVPPTKEGRDPVMVTLEPRHLMRIEKLTLTPDHDDLDVHHVVAGNLILAAFAKRHALTDGRKGCPIRVFLTNRGVHNLETVVEISGTAVSDDVGEGEAWLALLLNEGRS